MGSTPSFKTGSKSLSKIPNFKSINDTIIVKQNTHEMEQDILYMFGKNHKEQKQLQEIKSSIQAIHFGEYHCIITDTNDNIWIHGDAELISTNNSMGWQQCKYFDRNNIDIHKICTSSYSRNTFWIDKNGELYANGGNRCGSLGLENDKITSQPTRINALDHVFDVKCGIKHSVALCGSLISGIKEINDIISFWMKSYKLYVPNDIVSIIDNYFDVETKVYSTGSGDSGQIGHDHKYLNKWTLIPSLKNIAIVSISCGAIHTLFLDIMGQIYSCGNNYWSELGLEIGRRSNLRPILIPYFSKNKIVVTNICSGYRHNVCLDVNNNVYSWGYNEYGQCGVTTNQRTMVKIPEIVGTLQNYVIIEIKAEYHTSYARSSANCHFLWGENEYYQCTLKKTDSQTQNIPFMINDIFYSQTMCKRIKDVYLGEERTYIVAVKKYNMY